MHATAVVFSEPERLALTRLDLSPAGADDVIVDVEWTGISTGTERLLWSGRMPPFPGMGYPLVPGYEAVGRIAKVGARSGGRIGDRVFVPGARCFGEVRGLFGGAASRLVAPADRIMRIDETLHERGILMALAATAVHALSAPGSRLPDLIVGHGVLGRLLARVAMAMRGSPPTVWETSGARMDGATGYPVCDPSEDPTQNYRSVYDVSGDAAGLDRLIGRLAPGGEIVLAGFYAAPITFSFPQAFLREARLRVAAEWQPADLVAARDLIDAGKLSLDGLITHRQAATDAPTAYRTAFEDPSCLKMVLDWRYRS